MRNKKKLLRWANSMALFAVLARDVIQEKGLKTYQEKDQVLKYLEKIERLSNKIKDAIVEGKI